MGSGFETSAEEREEILRPLRVAILREQVFEAVREQVEDLPNWEVVAADEATRTLRCRRRGGRLRGTAQVTIRCDGPEGLPSTTVHVKSETEGALLPRDRATVREFLTPFQRRVC